MHRSQFDLVGYSNVNMSAASGNGEAQSPSAPQPSIDQLWEVQAILAERTSTTPGSSEVLVVWKPSWIPITNVPDGPILSKHHDAPKCRFMSSVGKIILPVEPGTTLADDIAAAAAWTERQIAIHREPYGSGELAQKLAQKAMRGTPRKSLGSVAKRAAPGPSHESTKQ